MADRLDIGVVDFEGAVVGSNLARTEGEEEAVVVGPLLPTVNVHECRDTAAAGNGEDVGRLQVEVLRVEVEGTLKVADQATVS